MEDEKIIGLYWARQEAAITETDRKYGNYCRSISLHILKSPEDAEECVNDTWMRAWDTIPPKRPDYLAAFLGRIVRNLSISRYRMNHAQKRGSGETELLLTELEECIPTAASVEDEVEGKETAAAINRFLEGLDLESRNIFVRRYFYADPVKEVAERYRVSESKVKSQLFRMRGRLREHLEREGIVL
ncbi:MAG: sigma-70 family RNA polymerase sigma factor [Eubacteriales bacterium]|nr:sigma-70 family RNA polymerase sigma factor [Eubacteriales bacterium]